MTFALVGFDEKVHDYIIAQMARRRKGNLMSILTQIRETRNQILAYVEPHDRMSVILLMDILQTQTKIHETEKTIARIDKQLEESRHA